MAITDKGDNTGNVFIDALAAYSFLDVGGDRNITYYFEQSGNVSPHAWSLSDKQSWQSAMQQWVNVANITAQESSSLNADLREAWVSSDVMTAGHGLGPGGVPLVSYHGLPQIGSASFNGEYNRGYTGTVNQPPHWPPIGPAPGSSGYWIFVSEIGHGLGLTPPFGTDQLANEPLFPGVTNAGDLGEFGYNQMVYTVLSPNRGQYISDALNYGYPVTPMAFDIAAIQFLYGPNTTFHAGSDGYGLPDESAPGTNWQCIWDTGGTDTLLYDGKKNATIDLRPASLVFGDPIAGGAISKVDGIFGGLTIAKGVVIENAAGGSGSDTLVGNFADNVLDGRAGDDTAVFSGNRASYTVQNLGSRFLVFGPDGADTLVSVEHAKFADATLDLNAATISDALWSPTGVRDLTGDGTSDVVWYNVATRNVDLWKIASGQWAGSVSLGTHPPGWQPAGTGDLNGDGTGDVLWYNPSTGNVDLWKIANGQWAGSVSIGSHPLGYQAAGIGDFDHDGTSDVLWHNPTNGATEIWKIVNGQWSATFDLGSHPLGWVPAGVGDFNHDGTSDIAWYNATTRSIDIWQIVYGTWSASSDVGSHPLGWAPAGIGDFNHDGTSDIAWYNATTRDIDIWQIVSGKWNASFDVGSHPLGWAPAGVGESNNDGFSDITWYNAATGNIDIWQIVNAHWAASVNAGAHPLS
ncbi:MAG: FG-GAP-like repeat-containing protein [Xanthobacteraceae bacterium]